MQREEEDEEMPLLPLSAGGVSASSAKGKGKQEDQDEELPSTEVIVKVCEGASPFPSFFLSSLSDSKRANP